MTVIWQASGTLLGSTGADITPVNPAHAADDILVLQAAARSNTVTLLTPSGWTLKSGPIDSGTTWRTYWFWKRATSAAETNPLCDWSAATGDKYGVVHNLRGATNTGDPFAAFAATAGTADPGSATGVTTNQPNQYVASVGMSGDNVATGFTSLTSTDPASYSVHAYTTITTGADAGKWLADANRVTAGATGSLSHDFNGAPLVWSILVAAVLTSLVIDLTPAVVAFSAVAVDADPGPVTTNLTPATMVFSAVLLDADPGMVTVDLTPAVLVFNGVALDPQGTATVNLTPAILIFDGVVLDPDPGMVTVNLTPASLSFGGITLNPVPGIVTVNLTPANLSLSGVSLDPAPGPVTVNLTPAILILSAVMLDPVAGGTGTVALTPAVLSFAAVSLAPESEIIMTVYGPPPLPAQPCSWNVNVTCCAEFWATLDPDIQLASAEYGALTLWAATGRRFGLCERTIRPCGQQSDMPTGYYWAEGTWVPYIFNGVWRNCSGCAGSMQGCCACAPDCQVWLPPPVYQVDLVTVSGNVIPSGSWRVDNGQWLVRTDGECWPLCQDYNIDYPSEGVFQVGYRQGMPVPSVLLVAAGELACEWARNCLGGACRLPQRVTSIARQGVTISLADVESLLRNGLTGVTTVDQVINRFNPYRLASAMKVASPDLPAIRVVTQP